MKPQHRIVSKDFLTFVFSMLLPLTLLLARHPFDGLYGQDPYAYYTYATGPLRDSLLQRQPLPSFFWPPGYPLVVALTTFVVGIRPLAGQIVSLIAGMSVPIFTMLLAKEVGGDDKRRMIPILAGGLVAFTPQLWQSSVVVMADTTGLAAATLGMWALARYGKHPQSFKWLGWATVGIAYAVLSRWAYALTVIPCGVYTLWVLRQTPRRIAFPHLIGAAALAGGILSPVIVPALSVYFSPAPQTASFAGDLEVYHWNPLNAFQREFETGDGFLRYALPNGVYYAAVPAHRYFFTPLLAWLILPGLWAFVRERSPARWLLILGWAMMVYGFHAGAPWQNFRFTLAYLPPLAVVAAAGWGELFGRVPRLGRWALGAVVVLGLGWMAFGGWTLTESFIIRKEAELEAVATVQQQLPADAQVITFGLTLTFQHYTPLETHEIFLLDPETLAGLVASGKPTYLFLELDSIETQWVGRAPSENYHWLRDEVGLSEIGTVGMRGLTAENEHIFTLFEVSTP